MMTATEALDYLRDKLVTEHRLCVHERSKKANKEFFDGKIAGLNFAIMLLPNKYAVVGATTVNQVEAGQMAKMTDEERSILGWLYNDIVGELLGNDSAYDEVAYSKTVEGKCMILKFWVRQDTQEKAPNEQK